MAYSGIKLLCREWDPTLKSNLRVPQLEVAGGSELHTNNWVVVPLALADTVPVFYRSIVVGDWLISSCSDDRFAQDEFVGQTGGWGILFQGVLLNKQELFDEYQVESVESLLSELLSGGGVASTLSALRGPFSGVFIDLTIGIPYVFGNQTGDTAAYVGYPENGPVISNSFDLIMTLANRKGWKASFSSRAAQMMLQYAFMLDGTTFSEDVQRVLPGTFSVLQPGGPRFGDAHRYWHLPNPRSFDGSFEDAVGALDDAFRRAVSRGFSKDLEYGFSDHLVDISAGLDSRMVNVLADELGYSPFTNITYSESDSSEEKLAIKWATEQGNACLFYPLDRGTCLLDPESILRLNGGAGFYAGITGGKVVLERLNYCRFGLEHTGQLGDVVFGTFSADDSINYAAGAYSGLQAFQGPMPEGEWRSQEQFQMQTRGFLGTLSTHLLRRHFTYAVSPFIDVDVLNLALSVPAEWRQEHRLYSAWIKRYHPGALQTPTSRQLHEEQSAIGKKANEIALRARARILGAERRLSPNHRPLNDHFRDEMNPIAYWYQQNGKFRNLVSGFAQRSGNVSVSASTRASMDTAFEEHSSIWSKLQAVTVVSMYELYFSGDD